MLGTTVCTCGQTLRVPDQSLGRLVCPTCEATVTAPRLHPAPLPGRWWRRLAWLLGGIVVVGVLCAAGLWARGAREAPEQQSAIATMQGAPQFPPGARALKARLDARLQPPTTIADRTLRIPDTSNTRLIQERQAARELVPAGRVAPLLALEGDPERGLLLVSGLDGVLRCYSSSLQLLGQRRLPGVAYHLALDPSRGVLYAAVADRADLTIGPMGDREQAFGDIHAYDVKGLLDGQPDPGRELVPEHALGFRGQVHTLLLSDSGQRLFYLADVGRETHIGRISTAAWQREEVRPIRPGALSALAQAPYTGVIGGISGGQLFVLDRESLTVKAPVMILSAIAAVVTGAGGRMYLIERRRGTHLVVLDVESWQIRERLHLPDLTGRIYASLGPDGERLYLSSSAVLEGSIYALDLGARGRGMIRPVGQAGRGRSRLIRGGLFQSADGKLLFTGNGFVFRTPAGA
jgi:hypothetical protein